MRIVVALPALRAARAVLVLSLFTAVYGCAAASSATGSLSVSPETVELAIGETTTIQASAEREGAAALMWDSSDPAIASVVASGQDAATITGVSAGHALVTVHLGVATHTIDVTVTPTTIQRIDVTASAPSLPKGTSAQLTAMARFSDGHTSDVSTSVTWSATSPGIASVGPHGEVEGLAIGATEIRAQSGAITGSVEVEVTPALLTSLAIGGATPIAKGLSRPLTATGTYTDATTADLTASVTWTSASTTIARISAGQLTAVAVGSTEIKAQAGAIGGVATITVGPAVAKSIAITPDPLELPLGATVQLVATATMTDDTTTDVTSQVTWGVTGGVVVSTTGAAHATGMGPVTISATLAPVTRSVTGSIGPATADHLVLSATELVLLRQQRARITATLVFTDGTTSEVTSTASYTSSAATIATGTAGTIDAKTTSGSATFTVTASGRSATLPVTVGAATCHPVINEVQAAGVSASDEWVELYNPCTIALDVAGWTLTYRAATATGATDSSSLQALTGTMAAGELRLYAGLGFTGTGADGTWGGGSSGLLAGASGAVGLRSGPLSAGALVDAVCYGSVSAGHPFLEGTAAAMLVAGKSVVRAPFDGNDTNAGSTDFVLSAAPTPRALH